MCFTFELLALPWETDDQMGVAYTDDEGFFTVEGCGDDLGTWNDPDPYLLVEHRCPQPGHTIQIPRRYKEYVSVVS